MKKIFLFLAILVFSASTTKLSAQCNDDLLGKCMPSIGEFKFLKSYPIRLAKQKQGEILPQVKYQITLNGGVKYRINACDAAEFPGKVIFSLYSGMQLITTSYDAASKKYYPILEFDCKMSGVYNLVFYYEDGKEGCSIGIVSQAN